MKTALEDRLSEALAQGAASVPRLATERVRSVDYHPRTHRLAVPAAVGAGAAAGAATVGTALAVILGGAAPAYAGWSPAPTAATTASPMPQADQNCLSALPSDDPSGAQLGTGSWQPVLTDVRGPFTVALFQNSGAYAACFTSSSFTEVTQVSADNGSTSNAQSVNGMVRASAPGEPGQSMTSVSVGGTSSGDISNFVQTHLSTTADGPYTLAEGRVASGITGVTLVLDNGQDVVATVADGWLVAWWPGDNAATSAQVTNASGTSNEALQSSTKAPPSGPPPAGFNPGACAAASGAENASKPSTGQPTNVPVHCTGSGTGATANSGSSGAGLESGG
jgi:hypothetical protein